MRGISTICFILASLAYGGEAVCAGAARTVEELRSHLIAAPPFISFRGAYTLEQRDGAGNRMFLKRHEYRFRSGDFCLRIEDLADSSWMPLTFACMNGLHAIRVESRCGISGELDIGFLQIPWGAYLTPQELVGEIYGKHLAEILREGKSTLVARDGLTVLSHRYGPSLAKGVDIYFDENGVVAKIEQCARAHFSDEEIRTVWAGDLFDVREVQTTLELNDYRSIGGVTLPTRATKTWWKDDKDSHVDYHAMGETGTMSWLEARVMDYTTNVRIPDVVQTLEFDMSTVEVNGDVSDLDFSLMLPAGTSVQDRQTGRKFMVASAFPKWRVAIANVFGNRDGAQRLNEKFGMHLAPGTVLVSAEPFADWLKPALVIGFAGTLGASSIADLLRRRRRKREMQVRQPDAP